MKQLAIFVVIFLAAITSNAQSSIVGKWKRTSYVLVNKDGTKTDMTSDMAKYMPCSTTMVYEFLEGGKTSTQANDCNEVMKKMIQKTDAITKWAKNDNKIITSTTDGSVPTTESTVTFSGNTMTWESSMVILVYEKIK